MNKKESEDDVLVDIDKTKVDIAARFLRNSNVRETEKENQETFLKNKGLSPAEIDLAFQKASEPKTNEDLTDSWSIFDYVKGIVFGAGILSAANYAYKAYILPYATRELKDDVQMECMVESLQSVKDDLKQHTHELTGTLKQMQVLMEENQKSLLDISNALKKDSTDVSMTTELKSELSLIKSMMLSKDQFRAAPYIAVKQKVNEIPAWQRINVDKKNEKSMTNKDNVDLKEVKENSDEGSSKNIPDSDTTIESNVSQSLVEIYKEELSTTNEIAQTEIIKKGDSSLINSLQDKADSEELSQSEVVAPVNFTDKSDVTVTTELNGFSYEVVPNCEQLLCDADTVNSSQMDGDSGLKSSNTPRVIPELDTTEVLANEVIENDEMKNSGVSSCEEQVEIPSLTSDVVLPEDVPLSEGTNAQ